MQIQPLTKALVVTLAAASALSLGACSSVEPEGVLKMAKGTLDGEPLLTGEEIPDRKPNTGHIPDDEPTGGLLRWKAE